MNYRILFALLLPLLLFSCETQSQTDAGTTSESQKVDTPELSTLEVDQQHADLSKAYFASGCFWCTEAVFERVEGVVDVLSGYTGGEEVNPTYREVSSATTGHAEAVVVYFDSEKVSYENLVKIFFGSHDPTQVNGQGPDIGPQYRSGIFYLNEEQRTTAQNVKQQLEAEGVYSKPIATEITEAGLFYVAEGYHQDYYESHQGNPYVRNVSKPKVEKFMKEFSEFLKEEYKKQAMK